jgi:hypothetical protein
MLDGDSRCAEGADQPPAFTLAKLLPPWVVVYDLDRVTERRLLALVLLRGSDCAT